MTRPAPHDRGPPITYGCICSGLSAPTLAAQPLGWKTAFFSEIEAFPRAILQHRHPHVPLHGDFTTIERSTYGTVNALVGGTPCQSFSVAGKRLGLDDPRGNLSLEYVRLGERLDADWLVFENVPGFLSSAGGEDFAAFISAVTGFDYRAPAAGWGNAGIAAGKPGRWGIAWRILDAQYFGVAQRRRRVFVVGYRGDWRPAAAVLLEPESMSGHPAPRRKAGQEVAGTLEARSGGGGGGPGAGTDGACAGYLQPLNGYGGGNCSGSIDVAACLTAKGVRQDFEVETFIAHTLRAEGFDASEDGTGRGTPLIPVDTTQITSPTCRSNPQPDDPMHTLSAKAHPPAIVYPINTQMALRGPDTSNSAREGLGTGHENDPAFTLQRAHSHAIATPSAVRRLTPTECERLQGVPDEFTRIPWRGKPAEQCPDGPRYKAIGNSMAVPKVNWILSRLDFVHHELRRRAA